jgi:hypothetical protein
VVPRFAGATAVELHVPCTFDFNLAATKYFYGLNSGEFALCFQISGTIFYQREDGGLQVSPVPWDKEARYRLPVGVWKELMEEYYPNSAWLMLQRGTFEKLREYKLRQGLPTWEEALERALGAVDEAVRS